MRWTLEYGSAREKYEEIARKGIKVKALEEEPILEDDLIPIYNAFQYLSATRTVSMAGLNPLQPSEVKAWLELYDVYEREEWYELIMLLDREWLEFVRKKHADSTDSPRRPRNDQGSQGS